MALGPIMGGALIMKYGRIQGIRYSFIIAIILAIIALFVQQRFIVEPPS